jgi:cytochrome c556
MNRHGKLLTGIIVGSLTALGVAGCATTPPASMIGSGDVVADRQRLMKLNGASWADVQAKLKAGNIEGIAVNAETIALNAMHIPTLFPTGSLTEKSKAKPEIWQKRAEFEAAAKNLQTQAEKLRDTARTKNAAATEAIVKDFGRVTCGGCHTPFRVPPPPPPRS